eukprot:13424349-Heterocapsa_arctica.AAC.1
MASRASHWLGKAAPRASRGCVSAGGGCRVAELHMMDSHHGAPHALAASATRAPGSRGTG